MHGKASLGRAVPHGAAAVQAQQAGCGQPMLPAQPGHEGEDAGAPLTHMAGNPCPRQSPTDSVNSALGKICSLPWESWSTPMG